MSTSESFFFLIFIIFQQPHLVVHVQLKNFVAEVFIFSLHNETIKVSMVEAHSRCITVLLTGMTISVVGKFAEAFAV